MMTWFPLENEQEFESLSKASFIKPQIIFKHSTRCSISTMVKNRIEKWKMDETEIFLLDLIKYRGLSNMIAEKFSVHHESPQILLLKNGNCIYNESHNAINFEEINEMLN